MMPTCVEIEFVIRCGSTGAYIVYAIGVQRLLARRSRSFMIMCVILYR